MIFLANTKVMKRGKLMCLAFNGISHFRFFREDALTKFRITSQTWSATHVSSCLFSTKAERKVEIEPTLQGEGRCLRQKPYCSVFYVLWQCLNSIGWKCLDRVSLLPQWIICQSTAIWVLKTKHICGAFSARDDNGKRTVWIMHARTFERALLKEIFFKGTLHNQKHCTIFFLVKIS